MAFLVKLQLSFMLGIHLRALELKDVATDNLVSEDTSPKISTASLKEKYGTPESPRIAAKLALPHKAQLLWGKRMSGHHKRRLLGSSLNILIIMQRVLSPACLTSLLVMGRVAFLSLFDVICFLIVRMVQTNLSPFAPLHVQMICSFVKMAYNVFLNLECVMEELNVKMVQMILKPSAPHPVQ